MSDRDRWTLDLVCPHCGNTGTADVSEGDYPPLKRRSDVTVAGG
jgi:hypothetical protein